MSLKKSDIVKQQLRILRSALVNVRLLELPQDAMYVWRWRIAYKGHVVGEVRLHQDGYCGLATLGGACSAPDIQTLLPRIRESVQTVKEAVEQKGF